MKIEQVWSYFNRKVSVIKADRELMRKILVAATNTTLYHKRFKITVKKIKQSKGAFFLLLTNYYKISN